MTTLHRGRGAGRVRRNPLESNMSFAPIVLRALCGSAFLLAGCAAQGPVPEVPAYVVFFTPLSASLDTQAQAVVADAARAARADSGRSVTVAGYAASTATSTPASDFLISRTRSQAVANALVAQGIAQSRIVQNPRGSAGGDPGIESRRVEIVLGH